MNKPQRPSADDTRKKILDAAKTVFLAKGYDGASISDIANLANVNRTLIFHHFENKESLWRKVKTNILVTSEGPPKYDLSSAENYFNSILDYRFKVYENNPDLAKLISWQQLSQGSEEIAGHDLESPTAWIADIKDLQKKGILRHDIKAKLIVLFIVYSSYAPFLQNAVELSKKEKTQYKKLIVNACLDQFKPPAGDS